MAGHFSSVAIIITIHFSMLLVAALADLLLLGFMGFTVACFAVAGVFSAVFCFDELPAKVASEKKVKSSLNSVIAVLALCALLFFLIAPLSGEEYDLPVKSFAVTESLTTMFLWRTKFQNQRQE